MESFGDVTQPDFDWVGFLDHLKTIASNKLRSVYPSEFSCFEAISKRRKSGKAIIDPAFHDFRVFLQDLGPRPSTEFTVDRINNDDPTYGPGKVRWATKAHQSDNRSNTRKLASRAGVQKSLQEWAKELGIKPNTLRQRLSRGWTDAEAIEGERSFDPNSHKATATVRTSNRADEWREIGCTPAVWETSYRAWHNLIGSDRLYTRALFAAYILGNWRRARAKKQNVNAEDEDADFNHDAEYRLKNAAFLDALSRLSQSQKVALHVLRQGGRSPTSPMDAAAQLRQLSTHT